MTNADIALVSGEIAGLGWKLAHPEQSPQKLPWHFTDTEGYFDSESSVHLLLKA